ncbi:MAG: RlmE family RNA methyltransferase [Treponema sp.]|jgi:23S rRNA (uridine2552-2'-O)-methyltransferase|nr:RlmE family RNA methyltransferase [Treponema sp.]
MADYRKPDTWALKAQKEGYPARSIYKLKEIAEKFHLFKSFKSFKPTAFGGESVREKVLDLGAAPGSWSLYVLRNTASSLTAVDIAPLSRQFDKGLFGDKERFSFIQADIADMETKALVKERGPFALVLSDAAPATTGNRSIDTVRADVLARTALEYAVDVLSKGGCFVVKVFQSGDSGELLKEIKAIFEKGVGFKPKSCRSESFETYFVGIGKK